MKKYIAMIVDDSPTDRYLLKRHLEKTEMIGSVLEAGDGKEALEMFEGYYLESKKPSHGFPPTFLFLDINMPEVGGFEFLEKYQKLEKNESSLVIMMFSSSANKEDIDKAYSYPCVKDYLEKGAFKANDIKEKISRFIEG